MTECVECREVITNPLCPGCLKKAVAQWLGEKDQKHVKAFHAAHRALVLGTGTMNCIKCRKPMDLCTHCYSAAILTWLRRTPSLEQEVEEYLSYFNFELHPFGDTKPVGIG